MNLLMTLWGIPSSRSICIQTISQSMKVTTWIRIWATQSGSHVGELVELWYSKVRNPRSRAIGKRCRALMQLSAKRGPEVLDDACEYALKHNMVSVSDIELVVRAQNEQEGIENLPAYIDIHENVRGSDYYGGSHEA